jgi:protein SCO1
MTTPNTMQCRYPWAARHRESFVAAALLFAGILFFPAPGKAQLNTDPAQAAGATPAVFKQVRFDQRLGQQIPLDLEFQDEHGQLVNLRQFFQHGPVILTLAYYRCPMLCDLVLDGLARGLRESNLQMGRDFSVVTVSIDPTDSPVLAATKHELYDVRYGRPGAEHGWHFLTGKPAQIKQLADSVGFHYAYDPASRQFAHASGIMILTQRGVLSQYTYGVSFKERDLRLGLVRASQNQLGSVVDQILLYCYHYDPNTGKYGLLISRSLEIAGALTVLTLGLLVCILLRKENHDAQN